MLGGVFGLLLGVAIFGLGLKAFSAEGLPITKGRFLTGFAGKIIGVICVILGAAIVSLVVAFHVWLLARTK